MANGRPTIYTPRLAGRICVQLAMGKGMRQIERMPGMPSARTIHRWVETNENFRQRYAKARERGLDALAEETLEIADDGTGDTWLDDSGTVRVNNDIVQRSKLRVDTRKWLLSKLAPKKYGEYQRIDQTVRQGIPEQLKDQISALKGALD